MRTLASAVLAALIVTAGAIPAHATDAATYGYTANVLVGYGSPVYITDSSAGPCAYAQKDPSDSWVCAHVQDATSIHLTVADEAVETPRVGYYYTDADNEAIGADGSPVFFSEGFCGTSRTLTPPPGAVNLHVLVSLPQLDGPGCKGIRRHGRVISSGTVTFAFE